VTAGLSLFSQHSFFFSLTATQTRKSHCNMSFISHPRYFSLAVFILLAFQANIGTAHKSRGGNAAPGQGRALYLITNDESNSVVALPIGTDGRLSSGRVIPTGGGGSVALNGDNQPATPDALVSQSALTVAGNVSATKLMVL
jgi:hypothetical protein